MVEVLDDIFNQMVKMNNRWSITNEYLAKIATALEGKALPSKDEVAITKAEELPMTEVMHQDLTGVTVLGTKGNAYVVFKNGYSAYLGKSTVEGEPEIGAQQDIKLVSKFNWIIEKNKIDWKKGLLKIDNDEEGQ